MLFLKYNFILFNMEQIIIPTGCFGEIAQYWLYIMVKKVSESSSNGKKIYRERPKRWPRTHILKINISIVITLHSTTPASYMLLKYSTIHLIYHPLLVFANHYTWSTLFSYIRFAWHVGRWKGVIFVSTYVMLRS